MINILQVHMRNFLSYGNNTTIIDVNGGGTTLITGENIDDGGTNGAGKTSFIQAISYGLYDKAVGSLSKEQLVNNINQKHMEVT